MSESQPAPVLDNLITPEQESVICYWLARVMAGGYGAVRLVIERGELTQCKVEFSYMLPFLGQRRLKNTV